MRGYVVARDGRRTVLSGMRGFFGKSTPFERSPFFFLKFDEHWTSNA